MRRPTAIIMVKELPPVKLFVLTLVMMKIGERDPLAMGGESTSDGLLERFSMTPEDALARYASLASAPGWRWHYRAVYAFWINGKPGAKFIRLRDEA